MIRRYFITGLVVFLPILITLIIAKFIFEMITGPIMVFVEPYIAQTLSVNWITRIELISIISRVISVIILLVFVYSVGVLGRYFFIAKAVDIIDRILHHIPLFNRLYKACRDVIHSFFDDSSSSFSQVVMVPYPNEETWVIGLLTKDKVFTRIQGADSQRLSVFIPGTPNPTAGFLIVFKPEQVKFLDLPVEEAFRFIMSCGIVTS